MNIMSLFLQSFQVIFHKCSHVNSRYNSSPLICFEQLYCIKVLWYLHFENRISQQKFESFQGLFGLFHYMITVYQLWSKTSPKSFIVVLVKVEPFIFYSNWIGCGLRPKVMTKHLEGLNPILFVILQSYTWSMSLWIELNWIAS